MAARQCRAFTEPGGWRGEAGAGFPGSVVLEGPAPLWGRLSLGPGGGAAPRLRPPAPHPAGGVRPRAALGSPEPQLLFPKGLAGSPLGGGAGDEASLGRVAWQEAQDCEVAPEDWVGLVYKVPLQGL